MVASLVINRHVCAITKMASVLECIDENARENFAGAYCAISFLNLDQVLMDFF